MLLEYLLDAACNYEVCLFGRELMYVQDGYLSWLHISLKIDTLPWVCDDVYPSVIRPCILLLHLKVFIPLKHRSFCTCPKESCPLGCRIKDYHCNFSL